MMLRKCIIVQLKLV
uniref:Uncharacterized protein n=1 Tax=Anguilla anguilla TaxID=7936 RepID=A0A0E9R442_ANGAN